MKKIVLLLLFTHLGYGQEKFESYYNPLAEVKYNIAAEAPDKKGKFSFLIECKSIDITSKQAVLMVSNRELAEFKEFLSYLKDTFVKWKKTAEENNITDIDKEIEFKKLFYSSAFSYGGWKFSINTRLRSYFKYLAKNYYIVIYSSELKASSNQFIKSDGFMLSFNSPEDFDDLINKLDENKVIEFYKEKEKKENLFKN
jgi:hypothetical protein